jgi:hypothetical protein
MTRKRLPISGADLRDPDEFREVMRRLVERSVPEPPPDPRPRRLYMVGVVRDFDPGEKAFVSSIPLDHDFLFRHVVVPHSIAFDSHDEARLFFHHDDIVLDVWKPGFGHAMPASIILDEYSEDTQRWDLYKKHDYKKGEVVKLGVFENVGKEPLTMKAAVVGYAFMGEKDDEGRS